MPNRIIKEKLAYAYQILSYLGLDDHTYTHLSARTQSQSEFYLNPFGLRFEEITPDNLMCLSEDGRIIEGDHYHYNQTGYIIHNAVYQKRHDIKAIFHLHTPSIVAVSAMEEGLLPLSQWALHFYDQVAYHEYGSLSLEPDQGKKIFEDLGDKFVMLMRHHGALICGRTIEEAMFYTHHLSNACETQCRLLAMNQKIIKIEDAVCKEAVQDLLTFEENLGERDWKAWVRVIDRQYRKNTMSALVSY